MLIAEYSSGAHQRQTRSRLLYELDRSLLGAAHALDPGTKGVGPVDPASKCSGEGPPPDGEVQTGDVGVEPCSTSRQTPARVGLGDGVAMLIRHRDDAQQCRPAIQSTTPDARPQGTHRGGVGLESSPVERHQSSACRVRVRHASGWPGTATPPLASGAVSGRMSMRHPVSLAARRAFCPSLPMASDSW